jgi:amino acid adenylation domain-containing protein
MRWHAECSDAVFTAPASLAQERFWFIEQLQPGTAVHNLACRVDMVGRLDASALERSLAEIMRRHDILRMRLSSADGSPCQVFGPAGRWRLEVEETDPRSADLRVARMCEQPFDLRGDLFRSVLLRLSPTEHRLVLVGHHAILDGWSVAVLLTELSELYRQALAGERLALPPLAMQFGDYAMTERQALASGAWDDQTGYWTKALRGSAPLDFPTDYPRPDVPRFLGGSCHFVLAPDLVRRIRDLAAQESATVYMVCLALFQVLLFRHTGQTAINVGSPAANRSHARLERMIGPFINILVHRCDLSGAPTFREFIARVRRTANGAAEHADVPLQLVADRIAADGGVRTALFDVALAFQNLPVAALEFGDDLTAAVVPVDVPTAQNDFTLVLTPRGDRLDALLQYNRELFRHESVERLGADLLTLAGRLCRDPDLPIDRLLIDPPGPTVRASRDEQFPPLAAEARRAALEATSLVIDGLGLLNAEALKSSLRGLVARHEALRTAAVPMAGEPRRIVEPSWELALRQIDARGCTPQRQAALVAEASDSTGLAPSRPIAATAIACADDLTTLVLVIAPGVADDASREILVRHLAAGYRQASGAVGGEPPDPAVQPADEALWQQRWASGARRQALASHWRARLDGVPAIDLPRPSGATENEGPSWAPFAVGTAEAASIRALSEDLGVPLPVIMLAGLGILIARHCDQDDMLIAVSAPRHFRPELSDTVGCLTTLIPVRLRVPGEMSFRDFVRGLSAQAAADQERYLVPADELARITGESSWPQIELSVASAPGWHDGGDVAMRLRPGPPVPGSSLLRVAVSTDPMHLEGTFAWQAGRLDAARAGAMAERFGGLIARLCAAPDQAVSAAGLLTEAEEARILRALNRTGGSEPGETLHGQFEAQAALRPDMVAVVCGDLSVSYAELNTRANKIAHGLISVGVRPGQRIAVVLQPGLSAVTALLGVLKAGACFSALDPAAPAEHTDRTLAEIDPVAIITEASEYRLAESWPAVSIARFDDQPESDPSVDVSPGDLAYLAFTSGSTGVPKGIPHAHQDLAQFVRWQARALVIGPGSRVAQCAAMSFDVAYCEIFGALSAGATLCIQPSSARADPAGLARWLSEARINVLQMIPRLFAEVLRAAMLTGDSRGPLADLGTLAFVGEPLPPAVVASARQAVGPRLRILNLYGPTEVVAATFHVVGDVDGNLGTVPIGRPIDGRQIYLLDGDGRVCAPGIVGEVWIRSPYLSNGYFHHIEETRRHFVPDPVARDGQIVYRTGDLARLRDSGDLEFVGRADGQVKLRGVRLELGAVEAAVSRAPGVRECVAVVAAPGAVDERLVVYAVLEAGAEVAEILDHQRGSVPAHMVPAMIIALAALPRTASGKVDRAALPDQPNGRDAAIRHIPPRTPLERELAGLVQSILLVDRVGLEDDFFRLGGNSLQAARLINLIREVCGVEIPVRALLAEPTLAALVAAAEGARRAAGYDRRLDEIEEQLAELSDDQIQALLFEHQAASARYAQERDTDDAGNSGRTTDH